MWKAAENHAFEQAAQHRDALLQLDAWFTKQKVATVDQDDTDLFGSAVLDGRACIHRLVMREGRMVGRKEYLLDEVEAFDGALLAQVLQRIYATEPVPARILVEVEPEDAELLRDWLGGMRGAKPVIHVPQRGEKVELLAMAQENARLALERKFEPARLNQAVLEGLQAFLGLAHLPRRIECFDISHTQGDATVAACVVYQGGGMRKSEYRRFNIRDVQPGDDYAAMRQAVQRRYEKLVSGSGVAPALILIDGGSGQVKVAAAALADLGLSQLPLLGVAKGEARKPGLETLVFADAREPLQLTPEHPALHLIQEIRDEAHRFAVTGHRARRGKTGRTSRLEGIVGIGPKRRKALIARFGGLQGISDAGVDQLTAVPGISRELAEKIYASLH